MPVGFAAGPEPLAILQSLAGSGLWRWRAAAHLRQEAQTKEVQEGRKPSRG